MRPPPALTNVSATILEPSFKILIYIEEFQRGQAKASIFEAPPFKMHYAGGWSTIGVRARGVREDREKAKDPRYERSRRQKEERVREKEEKENKKIKRKRKEDEEHEKGGT